jgi:hypothetical protein
VSPSTSELGSLYVSRAVKDLVAGSGIEFDDRGEHELRGTRAAGGSMPFVGSARQRRIDREVAPLASQVFK